MPTYRATVYTGNLSPASGAGTDANVYLTLYGAAASSDELGLDNAGNNFEQGRSIHSPCPWPNSET